jgi:hypothetical protein
MNILKIIEDNYFDEILSYEVDNQFFWNVVRSSLDNIISKKQNNNIQEAHSFENKKLKKIFSLLKNHKYNNFLKKFKNYNYDILFLEGTNRNLIKKDSFNLNPEIDFFLEHNKNNNIKSLSIENPYRGKRTKNRISKDIYFKPDLMPFYFYIKKLFLKEKLNQSTAEEITHFLSFLKKIDILNLNNNDILYLKNVLYNYFQNYEINKKFYMEIINNIDPKIIFIRGGNYGGIYSLITQIAHNNDIIVAEYQHGSVSKYHYIYNYSDNIKNSDKYKQLLPDYFLTYGEYWNNQINTSSLKYVVGNPFFYYSINKYKNTKEIKDTILIISQGTFTDIFVELAKYLSNKLKNYKIIFKLHPGEVPFKDRYKELENYKNIEIKKYGDIYGFLAKYENIVACYSTTIFEALAFNKKIYILDNDFSKNYVPNNIGLRFENKKQLFNLINKNNNKNINKKHDIELYFEKNWEKNYENFYSKFL